MNETKFMASLKDMLVNENGLAKGTADMYVTKLRILNNNTPFNSLAFLKDKTGVEKKLQTITNDNTRKSYVASIVSILNHQKSIMYKQLNFYYKALFMKERIATADKPLHEKTETQQKNWLTWDEVMKAYNTIKARIDDIKDFKQPTENERDLMERYIVLSLYVLQPPRRNADYYLMKFGSGDNDHFNYIDLPAKKYYFNNFKTSKYGKEVLDVPPKMMEVLHWYKEHMGLKDGDFLLFPDDTKRTSSNKITKLLNKIFMKNISSSMLRHIYLSSKYGAVEKEQEKDSAFMSHSQGTQNSYILNKE